MTNRVLSCDCHVRLNDSAPLSANAPAASPDQDPQGRSGGLSSAQSQHSNSVHGADSHFNVINTNPEGRDNTAPVVWLQKDLEEAKALGAKRLFVFDRKPAFNSYLGSGSAPWSAQPG